MSGENEWRSKAEQIKLSAESLERQLAHQEASVEARLCASDLVDAADALCDALGARR